MPAQRILAVRMRRSRLKRLQKAGPLLAASLVEVGVRCGRKGCHCERGTGHPSYYLTYKRRDKTATVYVPRHRLKDVQTWVKEYRRVKGVIREVSELSLALLKIEARTRRLRKTRRR